MFGHTWASQYGTAPTGVASDTWAAVLAGLTGEQLAEGLRACAASGAEFPPSAPRFRAMCLSIPSLQAIERELLCSAEAERSAFARLVWTHIDPYAYRHAVVKDAQRMRREAYELACEHVLAGGELPAPVAKLEAEPEKPREKCPPEKAAAYFADIRRMLGQGEVSP